MPFFSLQGEGRNRLFGVGLILAATFLLAISDTLTRYVVSEISPRLVIFARYTAFTLITVPLLFMGRRVSLRATGAPFLQAVRALCVFLASFLFAIGLIWVPVANASAIAFVGACLGGFKIEVAAVDGATADHAFHTFVFHVAQFFNVIHVGQTTRGDDGN